MKIVKQGPQVWKNLHGNISQKIADYYTIANETSGTAVQAAENSVRNNSVAGRIRVRRVVMALGAKRTIIRRLSCVIGGNSSQSSGFLRVAFGSGQPNLSVIDRIWKIHFSRPCELADLPESLRC